jgi:Domain of unknown function (DUF4272)
MEDDETRLDELRLPQEVARRALVFFAVWRLAIDLPRNEILKWLEDHSLRDALSPDERQFVDRNRPSSEEKVNLSWHAERLVVLLWAMNLVETLPDANTECDTSVFRQYLPPFAEQSMERFISSAALRSEDELRKEARRLLELHWQARDARLNNRMPRDPVDIEVVQERHQAINWVTGYCGLDWDDVTTDT